MTDTTQPPAETLARVRKYPQWAKFAIKSENIGQDDLIYKTEEAARYERRRGLACGPLCRIVDNALVEIAA